jgi:hypothetical protein
MSSSTLNGTEPRKVCNFFTFLSKKAIAKQRVKKIQTLESDTAIGSKNACLARCSCIKRNVEHMK